MRVQHISDISDNTTLIYQFTTITELVELEQKLKITTGLSIVAIKDRNCDAITRIINELAIELCKRAGCKIIPESEFKLPKDNIASYLEKFRQRVLQQRGKTYFADTGFILSPRFAQIEYFNNFFEHTYVLNIQRRADRWTRMCTYLRNNGIYNVERFVGYDGLESPHLEEWKEYMKRPLTLDEIKIRRKGIRMPGSWAILKSMRRLIIDAKQKGYRNVLVLQDDLLFHKDFIEKFKEVSKKLPNSWKLLYLGASQHIWDAVKYHDGYYTTHGNSSGAFAVGIDFSCYDFILNEIDKFSMPFDSGALCAVQEKHGNECIVIYPNIVIADVRDSDLRNSRGLKPVGNLFKWNLADYHIPDQLVRGKP